MERTDLDGFHGVSYVFTSEGIEIELQEFEKSGSLGVNQFFQIIDGSEMARSGRLQIHLGGRRSIYNSDDVYFIRDGDAVVFANYLHTEHSFSIARISYEGFCAMWRARKPDHKARVRLAEILRSLRLMSANLERRSSTDDPYESIMIREAFIQTNYYGLVRISLEADYYWATGEIVDMLSQIDWKVPVI